MATLKTIVLLLALAVASFSEEIYAQQSVVVVLDDSGSMDARMRTKQGRERRIDAAKAALAEVLRSLPADTQVGVLALNTKINGSSWVVPLGSVDPQVWQPNLRLIEADGGTPLGAFLKLGADALLAARAKQVYGTYRLLVLTDGEANDEQLVTAYLPDILAKGLLLDVIGVDMQSDHSLAKRAHSYRRADDEASLTQAIADVFAETSLDGDDASADFEILAALPDEFAEAAIKSLSIRNDGPIEAKNPDWLGGELDGAGTEPSGTQDSVLSALGGLLCCLCPFVVLTGLVSLMWILRGSRRK